MPRKSKASEPVSESEVNKAVHRGKTPDSRAKQNIVTKRGRHAPRDLIDPAFLSEADMQKRELFAQAYVAHGNIGDAALAAGYSGSRPVLRKSGYRIYCEPWVKARIEEIRKDLLSELRITQRKVLGELARIAFADIGNITDENGELLPLKSIDENTRRAISSYKTKRMSFGEDGESIEREVRFESKSAALEKLGKHTGLFGKADDNAPGVAAEDFMRALGEGIARVIAGRRTVIEHQP